MPKTTKEEYPKMIQVYDYTKVKEYTKRYGGAIFSTEKVVRTDLIEESLVCKIDCDRKIDKFILNGEEYKLVKKTS